MEDALGKAVPVAIGFLASLLGVTGITDKIKSIIQKVQSPVNKAIDFVVKGIVGKFKGVIGKVKGGVDWAKNKAKQGVNFVKGKATALKDKVTGKDRSSEKKEEDLKAGVKAGVSAVNKYSGKKVGEKLLKPVLGAVKLRYRLSVLEPVKQGDKWAVKGEILRMTLPTDVYIGVEIVDNKDAPIGEFDQISGGIIIEEKSAKGLMTLHPKTGKPVQTPDEWAKKQIYDKTAVRINNLGSATATRSTKTGSPTVPPLAEVQKIREIKFRIEASTPELQIAVNTQLQLLRAAFPSWKFSAEFG